jgi:DNA invertase Pin-like site-specific DNA recombinase
MFVRAYLRASTKEQDPYRAKADLDRFAKERGLKIAAYYRSTLSKVAKPMTQKSVYSRS